MNKRGFSLVELSISLAIIGMIAGSALSVAISSDSYTKITETNAKLDRIEEAIAGFVAQNYRLPCPAIGATTITSATFGVEEAPTQNACANPVADHYIVGSVYSGVVPVSTLQLPDDFMFDGWGRRFSYIVDVDSANNDTTNSGCAGNDCLRNMGSGVLNINYANGDTINTISVIMSHGENGHGAFIKKGSSTRINGFPTGNPYRAASAAEFNNAHFDNAGVDTTITANIFIQETTSTTNYFDDIVRFKTKGQLIKEAGNIFYDIDCKYAEDFIDDPINNAYCSGAADEEACEQIASEVYDRCLQ